MAIRTPPDDPYHPKLYSGSSRSSSSAATVDDACSFLLDFSLSRLRSCRNSSSTAKKWPPQLSSRPLLPPLDDDLLQQQIVCSTSACSSFSSYRFSGGCAGSVNSSNDFVVAPPFAFDLIFSGSSGVSASTVGSLPVLNAGDRRRRDMQQEAATMAMATNSGDDSAAMAPNTGEDTAVHIDYLGTMRGSDGAGVSSLVAAGGYIYAGSSTCNTITVWSQDNVRGPSCAYRLGRRKNRHVGDGTVAEGAVRAMAVVGDKLISAHHDHCIRVWRRSLQRIAPPAKRRQRGRRDGDMASTPQFFEFFKLVATMPTAENYLRALFSSWSGPGFVRLRRNEKKKLWIEHGDAISALAVSADGSLLYSASWDRSIKVWRMRDYICVESVQRAHEDAVSAMKATAAEEGGMLLYTGGAEGKIKVWAARGVGSGGGAVGGKLVRHCLVTTLEGHKAAVNAMALVEEEEVDKGRRRLCLMYSGGSCGRILVWEREESAAHMCLAGALLGHRRPVLCLAAVRRQILVSGSADKTIRVWGRSTSEGGLAHSCIAVLGGHSGPVKCVATSEAAEGGGSAGGGVVYVYSGSSNREIKIWSLKGGVR